MEPCDSTASVGRLPACRSCSDLAVSHGLAGLLRSERAGLLHPAADRGVRRVVTATRFTPPEEHVPIAALPRHRGRCPRAVSTTSGRCSATELVVRRAPLRASGDTVLPGLRSPSRRLLSRSGDLARSRCRPTANRLSGLRSTPDLLSGSGRRSSDLAVRRRGRPPRPFAPKRTEPASGTGLLRGAAPMVETAAEAVVASTCTVERAVIDSGPPRRPATRGPTEERSGEVPEPDGIPPSVRHPQRQAAAGALRETFRS